MTFERLDEHDSLLAASKALAPALKVGVETSRRCFFKLRSMPVRRSASSADLDEIRHVN